MGQTLLHGVLGVQRLPTVRGRAEVGDQQLQEQRWRKTLSASTKGSAPTCNGTNLEPFVEIRDEAGLGDGVKIGPSEDGLPRV